ncbi:hypothetical protein BH23BAC1_BH23BAC1_31370 [soil metagenome]
MQEIYEEIKTPYKYGVVFKHPDPSYYVDSPTLFRMNGQWYMTYIVFDGKGYETWLAVSEDILNWETKGKILSFTPGTWDASQKAGYLSLVDITWGGSYQPEMLDNRYWMSYLGGATEGYETGILGVGMAYTERLSEANEWERLESAVLLPEDQDARWFENAVI